jgi:hypothetical protein
MATKSLFSGVRASIVGSFVAAAGLAGCCSDPCAPVCEPCVKAPVYRSPCGCPPAPCAPGGYVGGGTYMAPQGGGYMAPPGGYVAPQGGTMMAPPSTGTPHNSGYAGPGSQMSCGAGKCG